MKVPKLKSEHRKLIVVALLASVLTAAPIAVIANAQGTQQNPVLELIEEGPAEEEEETDPPIEEETPPPPAEEPPAEETEEPVEVPEDTTVDILDAITIAKAAHDEVADEPSDVIKAQVKLKKLNDEKVFKVVFADGWRIYVRASDGEIVLMKDNHNHKRECGDRGRRAVAAWRNSFYNHWGYKPTRSDYSKPKHHNNRKPKQQQSSSGWGWSWQKHSQQPGQSQGGQPEQPNGNGQQQPTETEEPAEQ